MAFFADRFWAESYWHTNFWPVESASWAGYPVLPIDNRSVRKAVNMTETNLTSSGGVRQRNFQTKELFDFNMVHSMVSKAEARSVYDYWSANKSTAITLIWVDGEAYSVSFLGPPDIAHEKGQWWKVSAKLTGHAA
ncbi:MAG: hypothetical protein JAY88_14745 [Candidatus Thiodiazotropha lotti]|nr:hypothetical protein [Candidatus Thiodiazotropha lotti]MCW4188322.1 hypothetical protein [Candidatus Thiodiazotropha lotti]